MDMKRYFLCLSMITALALAGCGGGKLTIGGSDPVNVLLTSVTLGGFSYVAPEDGEFTIVGGSVPVIRGDVQFSCAEDCTVMVSNNGNMITSTGGTVTATNSFAYMDALTQKPVELLPNNVGVTDALYVPPVATGETPLMLESDTMETSNDVTFSCAAGGRACRVTVDANGNSESVGGLVTAADSLAYVNALDPKGVVFPVVMPRNSTLVTYMAPDGEPFTITAGGAPVIRGDIQFSCIAGGRNCRVTVVDAAGNSESVGGTVEAVYSSLYQGRIDLAVRVRDLAAAMTVLIDPAITGETTNPRPSQISASSGMVSVQGTDQIVDVLGKSGDGVTGSEFMDSMSPPAAIPDWDGKTYMRTIDEVTDSVTVYSNEEDATDQAFSQYYGATGAGFVKVNEANGGFLTGYTPGIGQAAGTLAFGVGSSPITIDAANAGLFADAASAFRDSSNVTTTTTTTTTTTLSYANDATVDSSFDMVDGRYTCSANCAVVQTNDGALTAFTGTWTFRPTSTSATLTGVIRDDDYLQFGYWLQETKDGDKSTYGIETFAGGKQAYRNDRATDYAIEDLDGTAKYSGPAAGMFVKRTFNSITGDSIPASSGQFTANAILTASFGGSSIGTDNQYSISGTVSGFMDEEGNTLGILGEGNTLAEPWKVYLESADFVDRNSLTSIPLDNTQRTTFRGVTKGGGTWSGEFFGEPVLVQDDTNVTDNFPTSVAGKFTDDFTNGSVIGAFGATKDPSN